MPLLEIPSSDCKCNRFIVALLVTCINAVVVMYWKGWACQLTCMLRYLLSLLWIAIKLLESMMVCFSSCTSVSCVHTCLTCVQNNKNIFLLNVILNVSLCSSQHLIMRMCSLYQNGMTLWDICRFALTCSWWLLWYVFFSGLPPCHFFVSYLTFCLP